MSERRMIWIGAIAGSTLGGMLPGLWHASAFSLTGFAFSVLGGLAGIWGGWRLGRG